jgi:hypothetical protein
VAQTGDAGLFATGDAVVRDDYSFDISNVAATGLLRLSPTVTGWFAKSVVIDGRNITNTPLTFEPGRDYSDVHLTLTQKRSEVNGSVIDGRGRALDDFVVVLFPEERTWRHPRTQMVRAEKEERLRERQALYGEFITEASRLTVDALSHSLEKPETMVKLYGILGRIRLVAGDTVLAPAEACCRQIVDLYTKPNMSVDEIRVAFERDRIDPLQEFSIACRKELLEIGGRSSRGARSVRNQPDRTLASTTALRTARR